MRWGIASLIVVLWGVMGVVSVVQYGARHSAERDFRSSRAVSSGQPHKGSREGAEVRLVTGFVKSVNGTSLVLEVPRSPVLQAAGITSKDYAFELAGATIKIDGREGAPSDLRRSDVVGVLYTESDGKLIAKVVTTTRVAPEK